MFEYLMRGWCSLPYSLRFRLAQVRRWLHEALISPAPRLARPGPISVVGFLRAASGLGMGARCQLALLPKLGIDTLGIDVTSAIIPARIQMPVDRAFTKLGTSGGITILHVNPPELPKAIAAIRLHASTYRVGFWVWELEAVPASWRRQRRTVNEIWVPSNFCADAVRNTFSLPVYVLPYPIACPTFTDFAREPRRRRFSFTVLLVYDVLSSHARKYPEASIRAFKLALPNEADARLVIKVANMDAYPEARDKIEDIRGGDSRIILITHTLSSHQMDSLYGETDVVISLHRSEGFGLVLAQAMLMGKCVIGTDWSGNRDFMNGENSLLVPAELIPVADPQGIYKAGRWAEPDIESAARYLRACYEDQGLRRRLGIAAARSAKTFFGRDLEERYRVRLKEIK